MFQKGNKYGKGRPKGSGYVQICRDYAVKKGWKKLIEMADGKGYKVAMQNGRILEVGPDHKLQFEALKTILAYGVGKPRETMEIVGDDNEFTNYSTRDIATILEFVERRIGDKAKE